VSKEELVNQLNDANKELTQEELEQFRPQPVSTMDRSERRKRLKYFKKVLKEHMQRKPTFDITQDSVEEQQARVYRLRAWATRYAILVNKIGELGAKRNSTGSDEQNSEGDEVTQPGEREIGAE
jgi:hypothetical protein